MIASVAAMISARAFGSTCVNRFICSEANPASAYTPPRPDRTCIARPTPEKYCEMRLNIPCPHFARPPPPRQR